MSAKRSHDDAVDAIAIAAAKLADEAAAIGENSLAYILRMAEIEARRSIKPGPVPRKRAAQSARAESGDDDGAHCCA